MKMLLSVLCLCVLSSAVSAQALDAPGKKAYDALAHISVFAMGGVGFAGTRSSGESALRVLLKEKGAGAACQKLLQSATPEGKLYALLGLSVVAPGPFASQVKPYLASTTPVQTMSGCIAMKETMGGAAQRIKKGDYRVFFAQKPPKPPVRTTPGEIRG